MSPYYKYKKEKFLEKYKCATSTLEDLKSSLSEYRQSNSRIIRRAIFAFFQDFSEYIIDMCEIYIVINNGKIESSTPALKLIEVSYKMGFFDETLKDYLYKCVKLRNRYTHDYYKREIVENQIEEFCYSQIIYLDIFLENSKDDVILRYRKNN
ncbi:MAG: DUF86 domain-containing protein [Clostridium argentinense]|uniref:DUF86 domain-containing protein n=1 Tax=Clostridium faecium TaxID=2762223 RepID=A0ABR8YUB5_9CLOT|nr:HepT-like ribonuclease domain-containing protein [Clostridium faecium]MBD8047849.1 DUF86 domain-containing protein [Clostridium faecium]MBS5823399.1 DUF86 domain-containing protein [Clostridium argentinense]MDU1349415.1 HepT-like ribonuclease domain-containing protein [Clostridium argentinense]